MAVADGGPGDGVEGAGGADHIRRGTDEEDAMASSLTTKTCIPCQGGVPPLEREAAERYLREVRGWTLDENASRIHKGFRFRNFADAQAFAVRVGELAEQEGHHPTITYGWGHVEVEIWTHKIHGLHENDFILAAKIDRLDA
jgi:4a-hydroxytetrahydrobiopterin dehydratase